MGRVAVCGAGTVGGFGAGRVDLQVSIERLEREQDPDSPGHYSSAPVSTAILDDFVPRSKLRRTDRFCHLALSALFLALADAGLEPADCRNSGLILATGYGPVDSTCGFKDSFIDNGPLGASPILFTKSVQNQAASHIAMLLGLHGPVTTLCQHHLPFHTALLTGMLWLQERRLDRVLVGGVDEYSGFLAYCRQRCGEENSGIVLPRLGETHYVPGEGAGFVILEAAASRRETGRLEVLFGEEVSEPLPVWKYRSLYGNFPSAAALDLAVLILLADRDGEAEVQEAAPAGMTAVMRLKKVGGRG